MPEAIREANLEGMKIANHKNVNMNRRGEWRQNLPQKLEVIANEKVVNLKTAKNLPKPPNRRAKEENNDALPRSKKAKNDSNQK